MVFWNIDSYDHNPNFPNELNFGIRQGVDIWLNKLNYAIPKWLFIQQQTGQWYFIKIPLKNTMFVVI